MLGLFNSVKRYLKLDPVCIDSNIFRLHYKATFIILVTFCILVTSRQYFGDPIDCIVDGIPLKVMDQYCWIYSTFTIPYRHGIVGRDVVQDGVAHYIEGSDAEDQEVHYHKYYQWVCFTLLFQAILFYAPHYIWKTWEGGRMKMLVQDLSIPLFDDDCKSDRRKLIVEYFSQNFNNQNTYAFRFLFCELLNFVNVVGQIFLMDKFLDGEFSTYGWQVAHMTELEPEVRIDPMSRIFPKVTKCTFLKYGPSGTIQKFDGLCVLPLNVVNEKIYVFLWFWFAFLTIITGLNLMFRMAVFVGPRLRLTMLRARSRLMPAAETKFLSDRCQIGDWFILYQLGKNIDPIIYKQLLSDLVIKFEGKESI